jgi:hypothetical protein
VVGKAPGLVFCAHCGAAAGEVDCGGCQRLVCTDCAVNWQSCPVPHARALELGRRLQVHQIDGGAGYALAGKRPSLIQRVFGARSPLELFDLTTGLPVAAAGPIRPMSDGPLHLARTGRVLWMEPLLASEVDRHYLCRTEPGADEVVHQRNDFLIGAGVTRDDQTLWSIHDNLLMLLDLETGTVRRKAGLPRRLAVQVADMDRADGYLAVGTWSRIYLFRIGARADHCATAEPGDADVVACVLRGRQLASVIYQPLAPPEVRLYQIDSDGRLVDRKLPYLGQSISRRALIDVSPDGRWLAVARGGGEVELVDLVAGQTTAVGDHDAEICRIAFDDASALLVTADDDGRVILRPRVGDGFAQRVVPALENAG